MGVTNHLLTGMIHQVVGKVLVQLVEKFSLWNDGKPVKSSFDIVKNQYEAKPW